VPVIQPAHAGGVVAAEFEEVESGKRADWPQLAAALAARRARRAALVIAKLDRLARNARFLLHVVEGTGEAVAELEAGLTSQRTRAALAAAKARGTVLGTPRLRAGTPDMARAAAAAKSAQARARTGDVVPYIEVARRI